MESFAADPDRLVMVYATRTTARTGVERLRWSQPEIERLIPLPGGPSLCVGRLPSRTRDPAPRGPGAHRSAALSRPRFNAEIVGAFACAALLLAAIGVYGVMSHTVSARTHEIGVRVALGADRSRVLGLVLAESARLAAAGAVIGLLATVAAARVLQSVLYGVAATDPAILAGAAAAVIAVALLAALVPARRASAVDPMLALRE